MYYLESTTSQTNQFVVGQIVWCLKKDTTYKSVNNERTVYVVKDVERGTLYNHTDVKFDPLTGNTFYLGNVANSWWWEGCTLIPATNNKGSFLYV